MRRISNSRHRVARPILSRCTSAQLTHIDFTDGADQAFAWRQLLTALGRPPAPEPPKEPERERWFMAHPYPMPPNFTGRVAERAMLSDWLEADGGPPLLSLRALGGFGKSALVWHWLHARRRPTPGRAWSGGAFMRATPASTIFCGDAGGTSAAARPTRRSCPPKRPSTTLWNMLHSSGTLLVLDGFERVCAPSAASTPPTKATTSGPRLLTLDSRLTASRRWRNCSY